MAIAVSNLTSGVSNTGASSYATASVSPSSNNLILLTVASRTGITENPNTPTATGNGITWVTVNSVVYDTTTSSRRRVTILRGLVASPSAGAITIDFGGQSQTNCLWAVDTVSGIDTTGSNGSGAVVQSATNLDESGSGTSLTITLSAFGASGNIAYGGFSDGSTTGPTPGSGFTQTAFQTTTGNDTMLFTEYNGANDTTVDATGMFSTAQRGGVALEIKAASATSIKTFKGLAYASVKTAKGLAIASVKTKKGLA